MSQNVPDPFDAGRGKLIFIDDNGIIKGIIVGYRLEIERYTKKKD